MAAAAGNFQRRGHVIGENQPQIITISIALQRMGTIFQSSTSLQSHNHLSIHQFSNPNSSIGSHQIPNNSLFKSKLALPPSTKSPLTANPLRASASSTMGAANDLLIVGPGVLGRLVAEKWREEFPGCRVYGQTMTVEHNEELIEIGINPSLKETKPSFQFPYVIFCAPPSRSTDYPGDVKNMKRFYKPISKETIASSSAEDNSNIRYISSAVDSSRPDC